MNATPLFQVREVSRERVDEARRMARPIRLFGAQWANRRAAAKVSKATR